MAHPFLEERLPVDIRYGARYGDEYAVDVTTTKDGSRYPRLLHPYPMRVFQIAYRKGADSLYAQVLNLYHRAYGRYAGFRAKCLDDYTTHGETGAPTGTDQTLTRVSAGVYQLRKQYGTDGAALSVGYPERTIYKPVAGTVVVAVDGVPQPSGWSVNTATGRVTFAVDPGESAVVTAGCEFDIPVCFDSTLTVQQDYPVVRDLGDIALIELLNVL